MLLAFSKLLLLLTWCLPDKLVCGHHADAMPQQLQGAKAVVALRPLVGSHWSLSPRSKRLPDTLQISQPGATFIAVNFGRLELMSGDKLTVRDLNSTTISTVTAANATALTTTTATKSPLPLLLWTHPFMVEGDTVVIQYYPSIVTAMLTRPQDHPVAILDSYSYIISNMTRLRNPRSIPNTPPSAVEDMESTIGSTDEAKEAVCYRKSQPKMYARARPVARLMIRSEKSPQSQSQAFEQSTWAFCTGWLIGRGNYLLTNHHCLKDAAVIDNSSKLSKVDTAREDLISSTISRLRPHRSPSNKTDQEVEAVVSFMAETKSCRETGFMGEKVGVVEATRAVVVTDNSELDYALLRVLVNNSATNLDDRYGYLRLRASGPVDGEEIYIPQYPRGEPKEIAATKDGKPTVIEIPTASSTGSNSWKYPLRRDTEVDPTVFYNADTEPGSSGSPVLSREDNTVVALHRAGSAELAQSSLSTEPFNIGIRTDFIANDLRQRNVLPRSALVS